MSSMLSLVSSLFDIDFNHSWSIRQDSGLPFVLYNHQVGLCSSVDFETLLCKARIEQLV
jgi:hypothetical protein